MAMSERETLYQHAMQRRAVAESHEACAEEARREERQLIAEGDRLLRREQCPIHGPGDKDHRE